MRMKWCVIVGLVLFSALVSANTIANITEIKGDQLTIDKGKLDGVGIGMKGVIKATYKDPSGDYDVTIGLFVVERISDRSSEIKVENLASGFKLSDARYVMFEKNLTPVSDTIQLPTTKDERSSMELIDEGEKLTEKGRYEDALEVFKLAREKDPQNIVIKERIRVLEKKIEDAVRVSRFAEYIQKADASYGKGDIRFAFLYLAEAYKAYPEGANDIIKRLEVMYKEYPQDFKSVAVEKTNDIGKMNALVQEVQEAKPQEEVQKPVEPAEEKPAASDQEPFIQALKGKALKTELNPQGYWEASFEDGLVLIYIPGGDFTIGSPDGEGDEDEHPAHRVNLDGFWISKYETTFDQFDRFCKETKKEYVEDAGWGRGNRPVIFVNWEECNQYCAWLGKKLGMKIRLPTEAEWERSANDFYPWGISRANRYLCNYNREIGQTVEVGSFPDGASKYGVMDLAGNVWEWIQDWYSPGYYAVSEESNPKGPENGEDKVVRGGCWDDGEDLIRSANRSSESPSSKLDRIGFRIVLESK